MSDVRQYEVTIRYVCEDRCVVIASDAETAAYIAAGASGTDEFTPEILEWNTAVVTHYKPRIRRQRI